MIILDTNVLSETLRPVPDVQVLAWLGARTRTSLFTTTITEAELLYGVRLLPEGQRKATLLETVHQMFVTDFAGQVLGFDSNAADAYAEIATSRRAAGAPISQFNAMIAAIARSRGARLATRNVKDFGGCEIELVNPWGT